MNFEQYFISLVASKIQQLPQHTNINSNKAGSDRFVCSLFHNMLRTQFTQYVHHFNSKKTNRQYKI